MLWSHVGKSIKWTYWFSFPWLALAPAHPAGWSANYIKSSICSESFKFFLCHALMLVFGYAVGFSTKMGRKTFWNNKPIVHFKSMICGAFMERSTYARKKSWIPIFSCFHGCSSEVHFFQVPALPRFNHHVWELVCFSMAFCTNTYLYQLREIFKEKFSLPGKPSAFSKVKRASIILWGFKLQHHYFLA